MKRLLPYLLLLPLLCSQPGLAFQAPDDFRGIHWGDPVSGIKGMAAVDDAVPVRYYQRAGDPLKLGAATLKALRYGFYRDKFYTVLMEFEGSTNYDKARDHLLATFGEAARVTGQDLQWGDTDSFFIRLKYSSATHQGYVFYVNRKIAPLP